MNKKLYVVLVTLMLAVLSCVLIFIEQDVNSKVNIKKTTEYSGSELAYNHTKEDYIKEDYAKEKKYDDIDIFMVPDSVTVILPHAFSEVNAKLIILPKGLKKICGSAFFGSDIEEIEIPSGVEEIGDSAFMWCSNLRKLKLNEGLVSIGDYAFERCDTLIEPFTLPSTVKRIGSFAFGYAPGTEVPIEWLEERNIARNIIIPENSQLEIVECEGLPYAKELFIPKSLKNIESVGYPFFKVAMDHPNFCSEDGVLYNKDKTVLIRFPKEKGGTFIMPSSVRIIDKSAFSYNTVLKKIVLSNNLDSIRSIPLTSYYSNLQKVEIKNNSNFKTIDGVLFSGDSKTLIYYPQGLHPKLYSIPENAEYIGEYSFSMSGPEMVVAPKSTQYVSSYAFYEPRGIKYIEFLGEDVYVGENAFNIFQDGEVIDTIIFRGSFHKFEDAWNYREEDSGEESEAIDPRACKEMSESFGNTNGHNYIDLDLPSGNLWSESNLNDLFTWGDLEKKKEWAMDNDYKFYKKTNDNEGYTKYVLDEKFGYNGIVDNKTVLDLSDDVAHEKLGGSWRIPTVCDWKELLDNCTWNECILHSVKGFLVIGKNNNKMFLPASEGHRFPDVSEGLYISSSLSLNDQSNAKILHFDNGTVSIDKRPRGRSYSIRAVCPIRK